MDDTLFIIKETAHNVGLIAAPIALGTHNATMSIITVISAATLLVPKLVQIYLAFFKIYKKFKDVQKQK